MTCRLLLFVILSLHLCFGVNEYCYWISADQECYELGENQNASRSDVIFRCKSEGKSSKEGGPKTYEEGEIIHIQAQGDHEGHGCSFEVTNRENGVTCCYISEESEKQRIGKVDGAEKLCSDTKQPAECRQPGSGQYTVDEIWSDNGDKLCILTLFGAKVNDSGEYRIKFPADTTPAANQTKKVEVKSSGISTTAGISYVTAGVLVAVIVILLVVLFVTKPFLEKKELKERREDEAIFNAIRKGKKEEYKKKLGEKSIFGLRDRHYNNIYHLASNPDWKRDMTKIVKESRGHMVDENADTIFTLPRRSTPIISTLLRWYSNLTPYYAWPSGLGHPTALDSQNKHGDTPLIIAAREGRLDVVEILLDKNAKLNKNKKGRTALYETIAYYPKDSMKEKIEELKKNREDRFEIAKLLLGKGASVTGYVDRQTFLHTAIQRNAVQIVKMLVEKNINVVGEKTKDENVDNQETAFQLAVRLGCDEIVDSLIEKGQGEPWLENDKCTVKTLYPAVMAGHANIVKKLMPKSEQDRKDVWYRLLVKAVKDNNPSAVGFLFAKHNDSPTSLDTDPRNAMNREQRAEEFERGHKRTPTTDSSFIAHTIEPQLSEVEEISLEETIASLKEELEKRQKLVTHIVDRLSLTSENESVEESEAVEVVKQWRDEFKKHGQLEDSKVAECIIETLQGDYTTGSSDRILGSRIQDDSERKEAIKLAKEKKKEVERNIQSSTLIVKKLKEENTRAKALEIAREYKAKPDMNDHQENWQLIIEELSQDYEVTQEHRKKEEIFEAENLLNELHQELKEKGEQKEMEAVEYALAQLKKRVKAEKPKTEKEVDKEKRKEMRNIAEKILKLTNTDLKLEMDSICENIAKLHSVKKLVE